MPTIAYLPKHGLTLFNARKETETHWIFENQDHDFPAAIHYKLESDSTITVSLLAKGEPFRGEHSYQLKRIKMTYCSSPSNAQLTAIESFE